MIYGRTERIRLLAPKLYIYILYRYYPNCARYTPSLPASHPFVCIASAAVVFQAFSAHLLIFSTFWPLLCISSKMPHTLLSPAPTHVLINALYVPVRSSLPSNVAFISLR